MSVSAIPHRSGGLLDRLDDPPVAGAAAEVAGQRVADLLLGGLGMVAEVGLDRHEEAGRAEAALEGVLLVESPLQRMGAVLRQRLDSPDAPTVGLDGEHEAGAQGLAVELNRARAADAVLAAHLRAGEAGFVADEVREEGARLDVGLVDLAVDLDGDFHASTASVDGTGRRAASARLTRRPPPAPAAPART